MQKIILVFMAMLAAGCAPKKNNSRVVNTANGDPDKYVILSMRTAIKSSDDKSGKVDYAYYDTHNMPPFDRNECAEKIFERSDSESDFPANYIKNGAYRYAGLHRDVCVPETVANKNKGYLPDNRSLDLSGMKEIPGTIKEKDVDSYAILPFDAPDVARAETEQLNDLVAKKVFEPSFSCDDLESLARHEWLVCKNRKLAERDRELAKLYGEVLGRFDGDKKERIKKEQREWLESLPAAKSLEYMYQERIRALNDLMSNCEGVDDILANLDARRGKADIGKLAACAENESGASGLKIGAGLWLGYIYLDQKDYDKADKYIKAVVENAKANCGDQDNAFDNFCFYYGISEDYKDYGGEKLPEKFDTKEKLYNLIAMMPGCVSYKVLERDPKMTKVLGGWFWSTRDNFTVHVCEDNLPPKYKWIPIDEMEKLDNYAKIAKGLNECYGGSSGTGRFGAYRNEFALKVRLAMFPDEIDKTEDRYSLDNFPKFEKEMEKYPDVKKAYVAAVEQTKEYYKNALGMPSDKAAAEAEFAIRLLIEWNAFMCW